MIGTIFSCGIISNVTRHFGEFSDVRALVHPRLSTVSARRSSSKLWMFKRLGLWIFDGGWKPNRRHTGPGPLSVVQVTCSRYCQGPARFPRRCRQLISPIQLSVSPQATSIVQNRCSHRRDTRTSARMSSPEICWIVDFVYRPVL
jgi:hypothetical protein